MSERCAGTWIGTKDSQAFWEAFPIEGITADDLADQCVEMIAVVLDGEMNLLHGEFIVVL